MIKQLITVGFVAIVFTVFNSGVSAGGVSISSPSICPNITASPPCTHFTLCNASAGNETGILLACPAGLLYNNDTYQCDFAYNVDNTTCTTASAYQAPSVCSDGAFRATPGASCASFDMCIFNNWTYTIACPAGTLFNDDVKSCYFEDLVNVTDCLYATGGCSSGDTRVVAGSSCTEFQTCLFGSYSQINTTCPSSTLYNSDFGSCVNPGSVNLTDCASKTYPGVDCTGIDYVTPIVAANNCSSYYYCDSYDTPIHFSCDSGFAFNLNVSYCVQSSLVDSSTCYEL